MASSTILTLKKYNETIIKNVEIIVSTPFNEFSIIYGLKIHETAISIGTNEDFVDDLISLKR